MVNQLLPNKFSVITLMIVIGFVNYWFFIKPKKFLNYNFKADKKSGYAIIGFIVFLALMFVLIANKNREKIFKEREKTRIENKR
jgi:amino acid transporter